MKVLEDYLRAVATRSQPDLWRECTTRLEADHQHLQGLLQDGSVAIYGANTLTGHRDGERVTAADLTSFQNNLLHTHAIAETPDHDDYTARCITYAKLHSWAAGHSGVSPELFRSLSELAGREDFHPGVPTGCSYSSGDVIPAAHWARAVLQALKQSRHYEPGPGEVMALINGCFVHTGYAASLVPRLRKAWALFLEVTALSNSVSQANPSNLHFGADSGPPWARQAVAYLRTGAVRPGTGAGTQDPVSMRAVPQVLETLCDAVDGYLLELEKVLSRPSGNPLFDETVDYPLSQASFLAPVLSVRTGALLESLLFAMWSIQGRTSHLLSGKVKGVPQDAASEASALGLIQYPKLMMATLEEARLKYGRRTFASGSQTSYGVEDLWSSGVMVARQLDGILDDFMYLCGIELYIQLYVDRGFDTGLASRSELPGLCRDCAGPREVMNRVSRHIDNGGLEEAARLFPVHI